MKLNVTVKSEHTDIVSCVAWSSDCQLLSCSDEKLICKWGSDGDINGKITTITNSFISCVDWFPSSGKQVTINIYI